MSMDYADWHAKIEQTLQWRENYWNGAKAWKRYLALFRGDHWRTGRYNDLAPDSDQPRDRITVNITGSTILLAKSFLVKSNPKYILKPRIPEGVVNALLNQTLLNYEWGERKVQPQMRDAVLDSLVIGHGIIKTGFTFERPLAKNPKRDGDIESREYIQKNSPFVQRINPFRFLFDVESEHYRDLDSCKWVAEIFFNRKGDVLANSKYKSSVLSDIKNGKEKPEILVSPIGMDTTDNYDLDNHGLIPQYEIWDKQYRKRYIFLKGIENPVLEEEWPYDYLEGFPYEKLDHIPLPNEHYGLGIPAWIEDQQLELNRVRTSMYDHRRRFNRKYIAVRNQIEPEEVAKLISGETGTVIYVDNVNAVQPIQEGKIPTDAFNIEGTIKGDVRELTGTDELSRGGSLPSRTSAAEIQARQQYTNLKLDDRVNDTDKFFLNTGRKMLQHIQANYEPDRVMRIAGPAGAYWFKYTKEDIQGEFDVEMETVSAPKTDELTDRQQAIQLMQLVLQNLQLLMQSQVQVDIGELFKWVFGKFGEKEAARFFPSAGILSGPIQTSTQQNGGGDQLPQMGPEEPQIDASQLREAMMGSLGGGTGLVQ